MCPIISSVVDLEADPVEGNGTLSRLLDKPVISIERTRGGRNSRVYVACCLGSERYAVKQYSPPVHGRRDRLSAEFQGLEFLWRNSERAIPEPLAVDYDLRLAVFEYIEGGVIPASSVDSNDIDQAISFLVRLKALSRSANAYDLPDASEACFSVLSILHNLGARIDRLNRLDQPGKSYDSLRSFLSGPVQSAMAEAERVIAEPQDQLGAAVHLELERGHRTLSPSDFGFHNALRKSDGSLVFIDFEHFGWDDPAKTISDFLLHPAMDLTCELRSRFLGQMIADFYEDPHLPARVRMVYPLFALKWTLILLNEFIPDDLHRREFAGELSQDRDKIRSIQLSKAIGMLKRADWNHGDNPFG